MDFIEPPEDQKTLCYWLFEKCWVDNHRTQKLFHSEDLDWIVNSCYSVQEPCGDLAVDSVFEQVKLWNVKS